MYTPVRVEYWDVVKDIEDYLNRADKLKRIYRKVDDSVFTVGKQSGSHRLFCREQHLRIR